MARSLCSFGGGLGPVLLALLAMVLVVFVVAKGTYEEQCAALGALAKQVRRASSSTTLQVTVKEAQAVFHEASSMRPNDYRAHLNYALFLKDTLNNKHLQSKDTIMEESVTQLQTAYDLASKQLGTSDTAVVQQVRMGLRDAKEELYGQRWNDAYRGGSGDMHQAYEHLKVLLGVVVSDTPNAATMMHHMAVLQLMLSEEDRVLCDTAVSTLEAAAWASWRAVMTASSIVITSPAAQRLCGRISSRQHGGVLVGTEWRALLHPHGDEGLIGWDHLSTVHVESPSSSSSAPGVYLATFSPTQSVLIMGRDAVMVLPLSKDHGCTLLVPSNDLLLDVASNVLTQYTQKSKRRRAPRQPLTALPAAVGAEELHVFLLLHFAAGGYYHWMCEALPRLAALIHDGRHAYILLRSSHVRLVLPTLGGVLPEYIRRSLLLLLPNIPESQWVLHLHDRGDLLIAPSTGSKMYVHTILFDSLSPGAGFSLAPPSALRALHLWLTEHVDKATAPHPAASSSAHILRRQLVFVRRSGSETSHLRRYADELKLAQRIRESLPGHEWNVTILECRSGTWLSDLSVIRHADVLVGVHGGALSNLLALNLSRRATVVEIGFASLAAKHYAHVANALGLSYVHVLVEPDSLGRSVGAPEIHIHDDAVVKTIIDVAGKYTAEGASHSSTDEL